MLAWLRSNLVVLLVAVLYLVTVALAMIILDKAIYQPAKQSMIFERAQEMLNLQRTAIGSLVPQYAVATSDEQRRMIRQQLQREIDAAFPNYNGVWRVTIYGPGEATLAQREDQSRFRTQNTWANSLFFRDFSHTMRSGSRAEGSWVEWDYTSPLNVPDIENLTHRHRMIALFVWGAITLAFVLATKTVILPIRRVMDQVSGLGARLLRRPGSALERAYNAVATQALAARLSERVTELVQTPSLWTQAEFDPPMVRAVREVFGFEAVALVALEPTVAAVQVRAVEAAPSSAALEPLRRVAVEWEQLGPGREPLLLRRVGERLGRLVVLTPVLETASSRLGLVTVDTGDWSFLPRWHAEAVTAAAAEVRRGLVQMPVFRDYLFRQKSQANISLARSLGHDLTNVIATSKFDILAIQNWLRKRTAASGDPASPREQLLAESIQGLLNTTKFMQEIVNIYRAFSYMDEPKWERVDLNGLVGHLCSLFRLTLSRRVEVIDDLDPAVPAVMCEPRLVQLALFNLLTNANQAIKRLGEHVAGTITVSTRAASGEMAEITVADSGAGIRGPDGALLEGDALFQVFFLGITTRREGEDKGEGLGLNWVWSIIRDFHGGEITPSNRPEGGAAFRLRLPVQGRAGLAAEMPEEAAHA